MENLRCGLGAVGAVPAWLPSQGSEPQSLRFIAPRIELEGRGAALQGDATARDRHQAWPCTGLLVPGKYMTAAI